MAEKKRDYMISSTLYDYLKKITQVVLPAFITLYAALGSTWGWPAVEQVVASIGAVNVFLGVVLGVSTKSYNNSDMRYDGFLAVNDGPHNQVVSIYEPLDQVKDRKDVLLKVK